MKDENTMKSKKEIAVKVIIPVLIVCVVACIWVVKNNKKGTDYSLTGKSGSAVTDKSESKSTDNPDFALHVTEKIDLEKLKSYGLPIVIDFGADSCDPCKKMAPVLKELNAELQGRAIIKFVDVWKYQALAEGYPIRMIPTQIFIDGDGKPYNPKDPKAMQMALYSRRDTNEHVFTAHEGGMTKEQLMSALKEMGLK